MRPPPYLLLGGEDETDLVYLLGGERDGEREYERGRLGDLLSDLDLDLDLGLYLSLSPADTDDTSDELELKTLLESLSLPLPSSCV